MGNTECTEIELDFQNLTKPAVFVATPKMGKTIQNYILVNNAVITQIFRVLNRQWQAFACIGRQGQTEFHTTGY